MSDLLDIFGAGEIFPGADQALCAQIGGDLWFPETGENPRAAKKICASCPVREACAQYALDNHIYDGVYGGLTREDRKAIWREAKVEAIEDLEETA